VDSTTLIQPFLKHSLLQENKLHAPTESEMFWNYNSDHKLLLWSLLESILLSV